MEPVLIKYRDALNAFEIFGPDRVILGTEPSLAEAVAFVEGFWSANPPVDEKIVLEMDSGWTDFDDSDISKSFSDGGQAYSVYSTRSQMPKESAPTT